MKKLSIVFLLCTPLILLAQKPDEIRKKYPENDFVLLKQLA